MLSPTEFRAHCYASAVAYVWRAPYKGDEVSDILKAMDYLNYALEVTK